MPGRTLASDMIEPNLEMFLRQYCLTLNSDLYEDKLYLPLTYLARSICEKRKVTARDYLDGMVEDMVSHVTTKLPEYYNPEKGTCKATAYVLMDQYVVRQQMKDTCQKRDRRKIIYIEEMPKDRNGICQLLEIDIDEMKLMKSLLLENKNVFRNIKGSAKQKIVETIIDSICNPTDYKTNPDANIPSFVQDIASRCGVSRAKVHSTIRDMRTWWKREGVSLSSELPMEM